MTVKTRDFIPIPPLLRGSPKGDSRKGELRVDFPRTVRLPFLESKVTSDAGRLAYRELDEALGISATGGKRLDNFRNVRNTRHALLPLI